MCTMKKLSTVYIMWIRLKIDKSTWLSFQVSSSSSYPILERSLTFSDGGMKFSIRRTLSFNSLKSCCCVSSCKKVIQDYSYSHISSNLDSLLSLNLNSTQNVVKLNPTVIVIDFTLTLNMIILSGGHCTFTRSRRSRLYSSVTSLMSCLTACSLVNNLRSLRVLVSTWN